MSKALPYGSVRTGTRPDDPLDLVHDTRIARFDADSLGALGALRFRLLNEADVLALPDLTWLVNGVLPAHGSALLYGPAGIGKSFLALDLALAIGSGAEHWHGRAIRPGSTTGGTALYVATEGAHGLKRRVRAWRTASKYNGSLGIRFLDVAVQLPTLDDPRELLVAVEAEIASHDDAPDLLVFDTLSRCMAGGDENSQQDASAVVASLDYIRVELGCTTLLVHHSGVNETRERGSTVFRGAVDALLALTKNDGPLTLRSEKMRDGAPMAPLDLRLVPVAESMVLAEADTRADATRPLGKVPTQVWDSLRAIATAEGGTLTTWKERSGVPNTSFHRARKLLIQRGLVVRHGRNYKPVEGAEVPGTR